MSGTLIGQKNSPFLGRGLQFTLVGQKNSPFLGRIFRPAYDAADRLVRAIPNAKQKTDEAKLHRSVMVMICFLSAGAGLAADQAE